MLNATSRREVVVGCWGFNPVALQPLPVITNQITLLYFFLLFNIRLKLFLIKMNLMHTGFKYTWKIAFIWSKYTQLKTWYSKNSAEGKITGKKKHYKIKNKESWRTLWWSQRHPAETSGTMLSLMMTNVCNPILAPYATSVTLYQNV